MTFEWVNSFWIGARARRVIIRRVRRVRRVKIKSFRIRVTRAKVRVRTITARVRVIGLGLYA